jgi:hypothetical protein
MDAAAAPDAYLVYVWIRDILWFPNIRNQHPG